MLLKSRAGVFGKTCCFAAFFIIGAHSKVAWSPLDVFDILISTKHETVRWGELATGVLELKEWSEYFGPATRAKTETTLPTWVRPWDELAETALSAIEDVRMQLEPVDTDTQAFDNATSVLQKSKLGSVLNTIAALDVLDGYLTDVPKWLNGLSGLITSVESFADNSMSVVFWMLGATLGRLTSGGETMIIWETNHPYEILSMFSHLQLEFAEAALDFRDKSYLIKALSLDFGDKEWLAFQDIMAYCAYYTEAARKIKTAIEAIMETKGFKSLYKQSGTMYPIPQELEKFYEKYRSLPPDQRRMTLLDEVNTMSEVEAMRRDSIPSSSIWLDIDSTP
ncbi:hypothetical protein TWF481_009339 [Arthrobotrys musiformis]|uniref:Uncharacterized protein n=1 Tax=Arthrobotrys musiformis TaxID=47236 RepID=A0AAV9W3G9_9PEZI